jgi:Ca-activated chloride channel family protein
MVGLLERWDQQRKPARVMLLVDVSGSMGESAGGASDLTKLDLAKDAVLSALDLFGPHDEVALRIFTTEMGGPDSDISLDVVGYGTVEAHADALRRGVTDLFPMNETPLYEATLDAFERARAGYDPQRINAVVLLSDGENADGRDEDDERQLDELIDALRSESEGQAARPVRVFTLAYGDRADHDVLEGIAEASAAAAYDASDPSAIDQVLAEVISNF